jgi:hypothetical protein
LKAMCLSTAMLVSCLQHIFLSQSIGIMESEGGIR